MKTPAKKTSTNKAQSFGIKAVSTVITPIHILGQVTANVAQLAADAVQLIPDGIAFGEGLMVKCIDPKNNTIREVATRRTEWTQNQFDKTANKLAELQAKMAIKDKAESSVKYIKKQSKAATETVRKITTKPDPTAEKVELPVVTPAEAFGTAAPTIATEKAVTVEELQLNLNGLHKKVKDLNKAKDLKSNSPEIFNEMLQQYQHAIKVVKEQILATSNEAQLLL